LHDRTVQPVTVLVWSLTRQTPDAATFPYPTLFRSQVPQGTQVYDTATLTGAGSTAGGTVTYTFYPSLDGTGTPISSQTVTVTNSTRHSSPPTSPHSPSSYSSFPSYNTHPTPPPTTL